MPGKLRPGSTFVLTIPDPRYGFQITYALKVPESGTQVFKLQVGGRPAITIAYATVCPRTKVFDGRVTANLIGQALQVVYEEPAGPQFDMTDQQYLALPQSGLYGGSVCPKCHSRQCAEKSISTQSGNFVIITCSDGHKFRPRERDSYW